jgi:hypothetical protein
MRQQINLYQPIFAEARKPLAAATVAIGLVLVAAGLIAFSINTQLGIKKIAVQVDALHAQQSEQEAALAQATEEHTKRSNPAAIQARVKSMTASLDERNRALQLLKSGAAGQTTGFAARMEGLARRHVEGLWIDHLIISGTNGSMSIAGATLNADIVPVYLQSLAQEQVLNGTRFDEFMIDRPRAQLQPEASDVPTEDGAAKPKHSTASRFIRFRAGNKALSAAPTGDT